MSQRGICLDGAHGRASKIQTLQQHMAFILTLFTFFTFTSLAGSTPEATPATKVVTLRVDGEERQVTTIKETVQTLLHQEFVVLQPHDKCEPPLTTPLVDGMRVVVYRVTCEHIVEFMPIPPPVITRYDSRAGKEPVVVREGKPGVARQTRVVWKKDGEVSVEWTNPPMVVEKPLPTIVVKGGLPSRGAGRSRVMRSTAYTPFDAGCNGITATGMKAGRGVVAVDPRVIPLGTRLYVEGYGPAIAADTGGAIKGNIIDVCVPTKKEAFQWGRRTVTVWILE